MASHAQQDRPVKRAKVAAVAHNSRLPEQDSADDQATADSTTETVIASYLQSLLLVPDGVPKLPETLQSLPKTKVSLQEIQHIFKQHDFRTNVVLSPRPALSIYKDSCVLESNGAATQGKVFLASMLGMHPLQSELEDLYAASIQPIYVLKLFLLKIKKDCPKAMVNSQVSGFIEVQTCMISSLVDITGGSPGSSSSEIHAASSLVQERVATLIGAVVRADPRLRVEQLEKEYERIQLWNSTFSNALVQLFVDRNDTWIKEIYFKRNPGAPKYERITIYLYDPEVDELKPPRFTFLPSLRRALEDGPEGVVDKMLQSFWVHLLRCGYFATDTIKQEMTPFLKKYLISGIAPDPTIPLKLSAHFDATYPLSFYLHGKAGTGKSSLVRNFTTALNETIQQHVDPEKLVRFVKQTLNKPYADLELELELRPNNNDLSVMSIIQGRRMTMAQSKPGLVVVNLEEMPSNVASANPNQLDTCRLISQRFSGRNGEYKEGTSTPRNSSKRGISGDTTLVMLFTSNYELGEDCCTALKKLNMFANLKQIKTTAVSGDERKMFALSYGKQCIQDRMTDVRPNVSLDLQIPFGDGDTRPLVRHVRMLAFYVCALVDTRKMNDSVVAKIAQDGNHCTVHANTKSIELTLGSLGNLLPKSPQVFDPRAGDAMKRLVRRRQEGQDKDWAELSQILEFFFAKTLAPAVVVSQDATFISQLVKAVGECKDVHCIPGINPSEYKMMKSLYDPTNTPNLRDDILKKGRDGGAYCTVELICTDANAQLCIREMIEDSPSMTAFSTKRSALYKEGLFFGVYVQGDITPEVRSRASLIL